MKRKVLFIISLVLVFMMFTSLAGSAFTVIPVKKISLSTTVLTLDEGQSYELNAVITPNDATDKTLKWYTSNRKIVTVDKNGTIKALKTGKAYITIKSADGKASVKCYITVVKEKSKEPVEISVWASLNRNVAANYKSYSDVLCFQELEKRTNVRIKWTNPPEQQVAELFPIMIASGDLPDAIFYSDWTGNIGEDSAKNNIIIELNDVIAKYCPSFKEIVDDNPVVKKELANINGKIYYFPIIYLDQNLKFSTAMQIRDDWLKKLNLKDPSTLDDWINVWRAFKGKDPNGNGKKDEVPLSGDYSSLEAVVFWPFGVCQNFILVDDRIKFGPLEDGFKQGLIFANKLYKEGLLDPDLFTMNYTQVQSKFLSGIVGSFNYWISTGTMVNTELEKTGGKLKGMPFIKGPDGKIPVMSTNYIQNVYSAGMVITTKNKHVAETAKWIDYQYSKDGYILMNFGLEGKTFDMVNGKPKYRDSTLNVNGAYQPAQMAKYVVTNYPWIRVANPDIPLDQHFNKYVKKTKDKSCEGIYTGRIVPLIKVSASEMQKVSTQQTDINTYVKEMVARFITGSESINNFNSFVNRIKSMKIDEIINIKQKAYDNYVNIK